MSSERRPPLSAGPSAAIVLAPLAAIAAMLGLLWALSGGEWSRLRLWSAPIALIGAWCVRLLVVFLLDRNPSAREAWTRVRDVPGVEAWARQRRWFPSAMALALGCLGVVAATMLELGRAGEALATASPRVFAIWGALLAGAAYLERTRSLSRSRVVTLVVGLAAVAACSGGAALALRAAGLVPAGLGFETVGASVFVLWGGVASAAWCVAAPRRSEME